jgi:hypothetical protein
MADLHSATVIADVDLTDTVEFPVRLSATSGLLRGTFAKLKTYLKAGLKMTDFSDVDISTPPSNGQALVWNSTASKFKPGAAGGGSSTVQGGALMPIATTTLGAASALISFVGLDQSYTDLIIVATGRGDAALGNVDVRMQINGDTGANYDFESGNVNNTALSAAASVAQTSATVGYFPAASAPANVANSVEISVPNYAGTTFQKDFRGNAALKTSTAVAGMWVINTSGAWRNTAAVNRIDLFPSSGNFVAGTKVTVYGRASTANSQGFAPADSARVYLTAATNTATGAWTKLALDTVDYDNNGMWNSTSKRFIPQKAGYYQVNARVRTSTSGALTLAIGKNGSAHHGISTDGTADFGVAGSSLIYCNGTTDYLELFYFAASARAISTGTFDTYLEVVGPLAGASVKPWFYKPPVVSQFTTQGTITASDDVDVGLIISATGPSDETRALLQAAPAASDWTLTMKIKGVLLNSGYGNYGMSVWNAGKTKNFFWGIDASRLSWHFYRQNTTTFDGYEVHKTIGGGGLDECWLRMSYVNATGIATMSVSADGKLWIPLHTYTLTGASDLNGSPAFVGPALVAGSYSTKIGESVEYYSLVNVAL